MPIRIKKTNANFEREPLIRPFGFKGGYMTEIWQSVVKLEDDAGNQQVAVGTQGVLWSDAAVFAGHSEAGGNALMYLVTEKALQMIQDVPFETPIQLVETLFPELYQAAQKITNHKQLRKTFILNALVAVDNALWLLYARRNGLKNFDELIPPEYKPALNHRHSKIASIPLMAYAVPMDEIKNAVANGYFFMKIKIGQPGTQSEMLEKDKARIAAIHQAIGGFGTPYTQDGKIPYYFDANGRYESIDTLANLLDFTRKIGAFDQIAILEEPFPEEYEVDVRNLGVRIAADESAHTDIDAEKRIEMGYGAIALKPIAKTFSMSLKIAQIAYQAQIPCFCADLTVIPILVDWNKNVAARLAPFPNLGLGLLETNGHQNYRRWNELMGYHPCFGSNWLKTQQGIFNLDNDFYEKSGGIFLPSEHYSSLI
ncbi:mandelate racemase/muconate lactonizing enzyme family protein [candidate division KSB1 bacterium]|nr:mandelate racemase/muconate lactonizing enzyme family protein [candidate division KSB1 bacterium]